MKQHKWHKEIKAWADGAEIECMYFDGAGYKSGWMIDSSPNWDEECAEFRIKPQPKEPQYLYFFKGGLSSPICSFDKNDYITDSRMKYIGKIKLESDDGND